jgi:hypothetical protein
MDLTYFNPCATEQVFYFIGCFFGLVETRFRIKM